MIQTPGPITFTVLPLFTPITLVHIQSNSLYQNTIPFYNTFLKSRYPSSQSWTSGLSSFSVKLVNTVARPCLVRRLDF